MRWIVLTMCLMMVPGIYGVSQQDVPDPINCGAFETFEDAGSYLREVYVSSSGSGDGSQNNPYGSISTAIQNARPGDIINIASGSYTGGLDFSGLSGTAEHPIQVRGPDDRSAIINGGSNCIRISRPQYVVLRNLACRGADYNGINCDDGTDYSNRQAAHHIIFDNLEISNVGSGGNMDSMKLSGVNNFYVLNSYIHDGSSGGSGIDMVGCHEGIIKGNTMTNHGSNFVQTKGGSEDITIHGNLFDGVLYRASNMGGSTGAEYFRPPLSTMGQAYEARHIRTTSNIFIDVNSAIGYVGCDGCVAANNVIYRPRTWVLRILQESTTTGGYNFIPSRNGDFVNNIIVFDSGLRSFANIGGGTESSSFRFANNLWYSTGSFDYNSNAAQLPSSEINSIQQRDPMFVNPGTDFHVSDTSPAFGGGESGWVNTDYEGNCYSGDEIGAYAREGTQTCANQNYYCCPSGSTCSEPMTGSGCSGECCASQSACSGSCGTGDINCDGVVNIFDLVIVAQNFGLTCPGACTNSRADQNGDTNVDIFDLVIVAQNFG